MHGPARGLPLAQVYSRSKEAPLSQLPGRHQLRIVQQPGLKPLRLGLMTFWYRACQADETFSIARRAHTGLKRSLENNIAIY